ncbi:MAG: AAA family ATPase, partial [Terracidiphilus sp.]
AMNAALTFKLLNEPDGKDSVLPFLQEADLGITDVRMKREPVPSGGIVLGGGPGVLLEHVPEQGTQNLVSVTMFHRDSKGEGQVELDFADESHGTQTLFVTAGAWLNVFKNGEVLLFDEIETSLHPLLVRYLIRKFHSDQSNPNNAQLIFTTHSTSLLNLDLFRRDQIWFVEKDASGGSTLYPLTDFSPRQDEALERGYMRGRYGALPILPAETGS